MADHFVDSDACVAPVLSLDEAARHSHNKARSTFAGDAQQLPAPAPRFSRTPLMKRTPFAWRRPRSLLCSPNLELHHRLHGHCWTRNHCFLIMKARGKKDEVLQPVDEQAIALGRSLLRSARFAALATIDPVSGTPLASRIALATEADGSPLILISALAAHTGALPPIRDAPCWLVNPVKAIRLLILV